MYKFSNQVATARSIQDGKNEQINLVTSSEFQNEMHVRTK